jgi:hypothetical protein
MIRRRFFNLAAALSLLVCVGMILSWLSQGDDILLVGINVFGHELTVEGHELVLARSLILVAALILPGSWLICRTGESVAKCRRERRRKSGLCCACGYDLTRNMSGVCPECGTAVSQKSEAVA